MGAKQTKIEGSYLPKTPTSRRHSQSIFNDKNILDPRSPYGCRTPIILKNDGIETNIQLPTVEVPERDSNNENTLDALRKRFLKRFMYNVNDPRSPNINFNRTPLVFTETFEKSLSLDDTFADLSVESHLSNGIYKTELEKVAKRKLEQDSDDEMKEEKVITHVEEPSTEQHTPKGLQQQIDPRSPSIGVERTPIIFADDEDETNEDIMLESILASLSLNMNNSGCSSVVSMGSQNIKHDSQLVPLNKHLDRVRSSKKSSPKIKHLTPKRRPSHQKIYEDQENHTPMTSKLKISQAERNDSLKSKRTPLSCVRNRIGTHVRSRSVESSTKSIKTRLVLTSFDDTLNCTQNCKIAELPAMQQGSENSRDA